MKLQGLTALVSGAAGDIGKAIVKKLLSENADVIIADMNQKALDDLKRELRKNMDACCLDITDENSIQNAVGGIIRQKGKIDILVNVAGVLCRKSFFDTTKEDFETSMKVNVTGTFLLSKEVASHMRESGGGAIINISSIAGTLAAENRVAYDASKAGVNLLTKSAALELGPFNIRVNAVAPGITDSKMCRVRLDTEEKRNRFAAYIPLNRLAVPEDIAEGVAFLASPASSYISGEILTVDGALTARQSIPR